eukprot:83395-Alexandrium_andersonii.AAC.1
MRFDESYRERRVAKSTRFPMVWLMAVKNLTVLERDYLAEYGPVWRKTWGDTEALSGRAKPFAMVWDADLQLTRRICEADLYIPASNHESDHI